jgi:Carboxypeptidase regulatory-like domain
MSWKTLLVAYRQKGFRLGSILLVVFIVAALTASARSGIGSVEGTVTDPTGAVVPGAAIHVVNTGTDVAVDTKSNGAGFFQVNGLFTGTYAVRTQFRQFFAGCGYFRTVGYRAGKCA